MLIWKPVMWVAKAIREARRSSADMSAGAREGSEPTKTSFWRLSGRRLPMVWKCSGSPLVWMTSHSGFQ